MTEEELEALSEAEWDELRQTVDLSDRDAFPNALENYWFDGTWSYNLEIAKDDSKTVTVDVGTTNENGVGIESLEKTPFEIKINDVYPNENAFADYFPVMLDADGELMSHGGSGGSVNTVAIQDRDISTVYLYICNYDEYMDEIKGYYWSDDYEQKKKEKTFKELLDERAVYKTVVNFDVEE